MWLPGQNSSSPAAIDEPQINGPSRLRHALRSDRWPEALSVLRDEVAEFTQAALVDEGDVNDVPARRLALLGYRARLHRRILQLDAALELRGLIDRKGKLRVGWLQQLTGLIERARSIDTTLGLQRRAKPVETLQEYLARRSRARENPEASS